MVNDYSTKREWNDQKVMIQHLIDRTLHQSHEID